MNTQQMPKHAKVEGQAARFREVIAPHKKGAVVVSMDFSSQEILLLAEWSHDPVLELAFTGNPPLDLHSKTGVGIWNRNHSLMSYEEFVTAVESKDNPLHKQAKKYRALGKTVNFGSQYRMAAKKAASVMLVTEDEAQKMLDAKAEAFPVSEAWALSEMEKVKETGISKTLLGAVRHLGPALLSDDKYESGKAERQTLSFRIQGSAAEMTKQAEGAMWDMGLVQKYDCRVYFPVHDEVVASVMLDDLYPFLLTMHKCMVRAYANMRLPIRSSVSFGPSFGEQHECNNKDTPTQAEVDAALAKMREAAEKLNEPAAPPADAPAPAPAEVGPDKCLFAVWSEGYQAQGNRAGASYHGTHRAATFKEACVMALSCGATQAYYSEKSNTYYGCRLFDNEAEARRAFG